VASLSLISGRPRLDLDNLYGRGPADQPYRFLPDGVHLALGRDFESWRQARKRKNLHGSNATGPFIGDKRNDEKRNRLAAAGGFFN